MPFNDGHPHSHRILEGGKAHVRPGLGGVHNAGALFIR